VTAVQEIGVHCSCYLYLQEHLSQCTWKTAI